MVDHLPSPEQCCREQVSGGHPLTLVPSPPAIASPLLSPTAPAGRWMLPSPCLCRGGELLVERQARRAGALSPPLSPEMTACVVEPIGDVVAAPLWTDLALAAMGPWRAARGRAVTSATPSPAPRRWSGCGRHSSSCRRPRGQRVACLSQPLTPQRPPPPSARRDVCGDKKRAKCTMDPAVREHVSTAVTAERTGRFTSPDDSLQGENRVTDTSHIEPISILLSDNSLSHSMTSNGCTRTEELHDHHNGENNKMQRRGNEADEKALHQRRRIVSFR
ncbi:hypothetical protein STCU_09927 [Strigomonas culicis]|uniref:Uncharacterized protein n=1 Tax=Strigomonas culicis TaxID=28005 RepID=S9TJU2_9TRYP|nr:hypothetical protein STCU_09927 [Strigomonas culicis]|eukprot:EPY18417.1 hypothetical protein STCU_09927 [Strigomonas culicis]